MNAYNLPLVFQEMIEEAKKEWELGCLQVMTTEAERQAEMEEDDIFFTYDREDATNKVLKRRQSRSKNNASRSGQRSRSAHRSNSRNRRQTPSVDRRYRTRSGASSPVDVSLAGSQDAGRKSQRIKSPNHVMVSEGREQHNHVNSSSGRRSRASSPLGG